MMGSMALLAAAVLCALPSGTSPADARPDVSVEPCSNGEWLITYSLPQPITGLRFTRSGAFFREDVWRVLTPGYRFARDGDAQVLQLTPGSQPQSSIVFSTATYLDNIPKEYEFFLAFTDGAVALYTGHLSAEAVGEGASVTMRSARIEPPPGDHAVAPGQRANGAITMQIEEGEGTYVYLGRTEILETPDLLAIVDPGMPNWLADQFKEQLPRIFETYGRRLDTRLPWKPLVLYSFVDSEASGRTSGGGALEGVVAMSLEGKAWRNPSADAGAQAFHLLAHEAVHLWNGYVVRSARPEGAWMYEGAADAMAEDLLFEFGIVDGAERQANRERALNECGAGIDAGPIMSAAKRGAFRTFYDCGALMALWTESALRQVRPTADLFGFWRQLMAAAGDSGGYYEEDLYFRVLSEAGVPQATVDAMRDFVGASRTWEIALDGLRGAGVPVTARRDPPASVQRGLAATSLGHLMRAACGRVNLRPGNVIVTGAVEGCAPFDAVLRITRIGGHSVKDEGSAAYDEVVAACATGQSVALAGESGLDLGGVTCDEPLTPRPPWYQLESDSAAEGRRIGRFQAGRPDADLSGGHQPIGVAEPSSLTCG